MGRLRRGRHVRRLQQLRRGRRHHRPRQVHLVDHRPGRRTPTCPGTSHGGARTSPAPSPSTRRAGRNATPAEVKEALRYLGNLNWRTSTDPDSIHEPLLDVSRLGTLGTFDLDAPDATAPTGESSAAARPRSRSRSRAARRSSSGSASSHDRFPPAGAPRSPRRACRLDRRRDRRSSLTVPSGTPQGTYHCRRRPATRAGSRRRPSTVEVSSDDPTATAADDPPVARHRRRDASSGPTRARRVHWPAATDPSSGDRRLPAPAAARTAARGARRPRPRRRRTAAIRSLYLDDAYQFRVRAKDSDRQLEPVGRAGPPLTGAPSSDRSSS